MAKVVDALVSGTSVSNDVQVRVLFWAQRNSPGLMSGAVSLTVTSFSDYLPAFRQYRVLPNDLFGDWLELDSITLKVTGKTYNRVTFLSV